MTRKQPETSPATAVFYRGKARRFLDWLSERTSRELARIDTLEVLAFRKTESERVSAHSVNPAAAVIMATGGAIDPALFPS